MAASKSFQHLRFPWRFNERSSFMLIPIPKSLDLQLQPYKQGFLYAIKQTMRAIAEKDTNFLSRVMQKRIFQEFKNGLDILQRRHHKLQLINTDTFCYSYLYNEQLSLGGHINRDQNQIQRIINYNPKHSIKNELKIRAENTNLYVTKDISTHLLLKVDVILNSAFKFIVKDENGDIIIGDNNKWPENHKFRFQTMLESKPGIFQLISKSFQIGMYSSGFSQKPLFDYEDWMITDVDEFLEGNPLVKNKEKNQQLD